MSSINNPLLIQDSLGPIFTSETRNYNGIPYTVYNLQRDISWNTTYLISGLSNDDDYIELKAYEAIDGKGFTIYRTNFNCSGLIDVSQVSVDSFNKAPIVGNFKYIIQNGSIESLIKSPPPSPPPPNNYKHYVIINYVYLEGSTFSGGVLSTNCARDGKAIINNCISKQVFTTTKQGGIVSNSVGLRGEVIINNCVYIGDLNQEECGGIVGWEFSRTENISLSGAYGEINNCFMIGNINADQCGGIAGENSFSGSINFGSQSADGTGVINNCYFIGDISNGIGIGSSAGIIGPNCGRGGSTNFNPVPGGSNTLTINNCYTITNDLSNNFSLIGANCGGSVPVISGQAGTGEVIFNNCVGKTPLSGPTSGTITNNNSTTNLNVIFGQLYSNWSTTIWESVSSDYPILRNYLLDIYSGYSINIDEPILNFPIDPLAPIPQPQPQPQPIPPTPTKKDKTKKDNLPNTNRQINKLLYNLNKRTINTIKNKKYLPRYSENSMLIMKKKIIAYGNYKIS